MDSRESRDTGLRAEIDLSAVRHNVRAVRAHVKPPTRVLAVVKADAYGHGALPVARAALESGAEWLGVATVAEGVELRQQLPSVPIAVFAPFAPAEAEDVVARRLTPFVGDRESATALDRAAARLGVSADVHLEIDSGMGRSGVLPGAAGDLAVAILALPAIRITGICTHFASADDDPEFTCQQLEAFEQARTAVSRAGAQPAIVHCANSAAMLRYPESRFTMVRSGLLLYGIRPPVPLNVCGPAIRPALTLKASIHLIRRLPAGNTVSYGRTYTLRRDSRVATLRVGYGDGYPRALGGSGCVLIRGRRAPILGRICMDVTMVDVTDISEARVGDEVVLIGAQGAERITVEETADAIGTTYHDVTTRLTGRTRRVYVAESDTGVIDAQ